MKHPAPDPLRGTLLFLVLCAAPLAQKSADDTESVAPSTFASTASAPATQAVELLRDSRLPDARPVPETVAAIAELAPACLPELSALLVREQIPPLGKDQKTQMLSVPQRDMLLSAFEDLSPSDLRQEAGRLLALDSGRKTRQAVIRLLGACCTTGDVLGLVELTRAEPEAAPGVDELSALRSSLSRMVRRDPHSMQGLTALVRAEHPALVSIAALVIGDVGDSRGLELLLEVATHNPDLAALAIAQVRKVGRSSSYVINDSFGDLLRGDLDASKPARCRTAIIALGELSHFDAMPELIDLLQKSGDLREDALWALRRMTGLRFSDDPLRWRRWHKAELAWYEREYPYLLRDLHSRVSVRATAAVTAISAHRIYRHELADQLSRALLEAVPGRKRALCSALRALDSEQAIPALVETLGFQREEVQVAAHRALVSLTGLSLPMEQLAWKAALGAKPEAPAIAAPR